MLLQPNMMSRLNANALHICIRSMDTPPPAIRTVQARCCEILTRSTRSALIGVKPEIIDAYQGDCARGHHDFAIPGDGLPLFIQRSSEEKLIMRTDSDIKRDVEEEI